MYPLTQCSDRILISCAGVGMGNASRVIAVVEALTELAAQQDKQVSFHIVTWGSAYRFLQEYKRESSLAFELIQAHGYEQIHSPRRVAGNLSAFARNLRLLRETVKRVHPDLILLDSDYHFPAYFRAGCPIVYIGQAADVVERAKRDAYRPSNWRERMNFACREKFDSFIQGLFSHWILVPSFSSGGARDEKIRKIPLIVRKEFLEKEQAAGKSVGILLSGSELEKAAFMNLARKYGLKILAPEVRTVPSHAGTLDEFDIIFTQGGLSSISEGIARSKFLVVFPMRDHSEQMLNAAEVQQLGLGMKSQIEDLEDFPKLLQTAIRRRASAKKSVIELNGAEVAANYIFAVLAEKNVRQPIHEVSRRKAHAGIPAQY